MRTFAFKTSLFVLEASGHQIHEPLPGRHILSEPLVDTSAWANSVNNTRPEMTDDMFYNSPLGCSRLWSPLFFLIFYSLHILLFRRGVFSREEKEFLWRIAFNVLFAVFFSTQPPFLVLRTSTSVAGIKLLSKESFMDETRSGDERGERNFDKAFWGMRGGPRRMERTPAFMNRDG